jgi:hypothetical protein
MLSFTTTGVAKACVAATILAALVISTDASPREGAQVLERKEAATGPTRNPFVLLKHRFLGGAITTRTTAPTTPSSDSVKPPMAMPMDLAESAAALGVSKASFAERGLEAQQPPHNFTVQTRDRRELGELDDWMDARSTWYGGPSGPGPDGMSIYTGSCGYGRIGNHFISAWQGRVVFPGG